MTPNPDPVTPPDWMTEPAVGRRGCAILPALVFGVLVWIVLAVVVVAVFTGAGRG